MSHLSSRRNDLSQISEFLGEHNRSIPIEKRKHLSKFIFLNIKFWELLSYDNSVPQIVFVFVYKYGARGYWSTVYTQNEREHYSKNLIAVDVYYHTIGFSMHMLYRYLHNKL